MGQQLDPIRQGDPLDLIVELRYREFPQTGELITDVYNGTESLSSRIWAGDDRAVAATITTTWEDAPGGLVALYADGAVTATLARGVYAIEVLLEDSPVWSGELEVEAAPGAATAPSTYGTYDGMLGCAGAWLSKLDDEAAQAGYAEELHKAWLWTHRQVVARARMLLEHRLLRGYLGDAEAAQLVDATSGADPLTIEGRLDVIRAALAAGGLAVDDDIIEANERYAASVVLGRVLGGKDDKGRFQSDSRDLKGRANALLGSVTFAVDTDDDGEAEVSLGPV